ncbi:MAG TPA: hypothetical protein VIH90_02120 [Candidatus Saccharimonadales bacterium]
MESNKNDLTVSKLTWKFFKGYLALGSSIFVIMLVATLRSRNTALDGTVHRSHLRIIVELSVLIVGLLALVLLGAYYLALRQIKHKRTDLEVNLPSTPGTILTFQTDYQKFQLKANHGGILTIYKDKIVFSPTKHLQPDPSRQELIIPREQVTDVKCFNQLGTTEPTLVIHTSTGNHTFLNSHVDIETVLNVIRPESQSQNTTTQ